LADELEAGIRLALGRRRAAGLSGSDTQFGLGFSYREALHGKTLIFAVSACDRIRAAEDHRTGLRR